MEAKGKIRAAASSARATTERRPELVFWIALACAAIAHAALIVGFVRSLPQRQMGEKSGMPEGVSVAMVDPADLASQSAFADRARPPRAVAQAPPSPPAAPRMEEQPPESTPREKEQRVVEPDSQDEVARQGKDGKALDTVPWQIDLKALEQDFSPDRPGKQRDTAASRPADKRPEQQTASARPNLQLTLPDSAISSDELLPFSRPAGVTRSGENDEFGRAVIRALRKTMPDMGSTRGRVPVRFVISQNGNLAEVRLTRSSGNPLLDQAVLFAVQQTSFPFPPPNAPPVDRTFLVTYIYDDRG
jgi:TonB family protein